MSQKSQMVQVESKNKKIELNINCSKVNRDIFTIIKNLSENDELVVLPNTAKKNNAIELLKQSKEC